MIINKITLVTIVVISVKHHINPVYLSTAHKYKVEVLLLYLNLSVFCYFILL